MNKADRKKREEEITQMESKNVGQTRMIIEIVEDQLKDIQSRQNKILSARGYSDTQIETIYQQARGFTKSFERKEKEKIEGAFKEDDDALKEVLLSEYGTFLQQCQMTQRDEFIKGLDVTDEFDFRKQQEFAKKVLEEKKENKQEELEEETKNSILPQDPIM